MHEDIRANINVTMKTLRKQLVLVGTQDMLLGVVLAVKSDTHSNNYQDPPPPQPTNPKQKPRFMPEWPSLGALGIGGVNAWF